LLRRERLALRAFDELGFDGVEWANQIIQFEPVQMTFASLVSFLYPDADFVPCPVIAGINERARSRMPAVTSPVELLQT
jgi:hypothetical protein